MTIDQATLKELGIELTEAELATFQQLFSEKLDERVGLAIFDLLDDNDASELIKLQDSAEPSVVADWIKVKFPDYADIVKDEYDILLSEIAEDPKAFTAS